ATARLSSSPLFPYTTLFRSRLSLGDLSGWQVFCFYGFSGQRRSPGQHQLQKSACFDFFHIAYHTVFPFFFVPLLIKLVFFLPRRSEEHTSELQSRFDLVCRL